MKANGKLKILQLSAVIFLTISGGPFGLEALPGLVGNNGALWLLIITPLLWDIPTILTVLELNSMMPVTGGYYQWVKKALGLRFAWYEGWWTWLYTFVDLAIYPVLFTEYLSFFFPGAETYRIPVCLAVIWISAMLNIRGIVAVGRTAVLLGIIVVLPFIIMILLYFFGTHASPVPSQQAAGHELKGIGLALYIVMWNFLGWDNVTTYAEEVSQPARTYLRSVFTAFITIALVYLLVMFVTTRSGIGYAILEDQGFPSLGTFIGGHWLGALIACGGMASGLGLYSSVLLSVSRVPKVMADDKLLPASLNRLHNSYATPYVSIICCSVIVSFMVIFPFAELLIMDVVIYGAALFLEFVTLIVMRKRWPDAQRPFRIPLNVPGLVLMLLIPVCVYFLALTGSVMSEGTAMRPLFIALGVLLSGEVLWQIISLRKKRAGREPVA